MQPTRIGPYTIDALLGEGGMGQVFRAHDPRLGRTVAIKVSREEFTSRFQREARAIAALNHPHVCTLYDIGPGYLAMEFIEARPWPTGLHVVGWGWSAPCCSVRRSPAHWPRRMPGASSIVT